MAAVVPVYRYRIAVLRVVDGDTLETDVDLGFYTWVRKVKLRLKGINCPEMGTPEGLAAKEFTTKLLGISSILPLSPPTYSAPTESPSSPAMAHSLPLPLEPPETGHVFSPSVLLAVSPVITADTVKPDKYGNRWDARVYLPDGRCLNDVLVEAGHAKKVK